MVSSALSCLGVLRSVALCQLQDMVKPPIFWLGATTTIGSCLLCLHSLPGILLLAAVVFPSWLTVTNLFVLDVRGFAIANSKVGSSSVCRPFEAGLLGISDLDVDTQHALFPHLQCSPSSSPATNKWKWSDVGLAPVLHDFTKRPQDCSIESFSSLGTATHPATEPEAAAPAGSEVALARHAKQNSKPHKSRKLRSHCKAASDNSNIRMPSSNCSPEPADYLVSLRWGRPSDPSPSTPKRIPIYGPYQSSEGPRLAPKCSAAAASFPREIASHHHTDEPANPEPQTPSKTRSPSVARACVTLPGFSALPRSLSPGDAGRDTPKQRPEIQQQQQFHVPPMQGKSPVWPQLQNLCGCMR